MPVSPAVQAAVFLCFRVLLLRSNPIIIISIVFSFLSSDQLTLQDECSAHHLLVAGDHHGDGLGLLRHGARARHGAARVQVLIKDE